MSRIIHFEIYADDPDALMDFYGDVFDWSFEKFEESTEDYWSIRAGPEEEPGIDGGLMRWNKDQWGDHQPGWAYICTISVEAIDDALERVEEYGGTVDVDKMDIPGIGWHAYCTDPEGNRFGIMESTTDVPPTGD